MVIDLLVFLVLTVIAAILVTLASVAYYASYKTEYFVEPFYDNEKEFEDFKFDDIDIGKTLGEGSFFYVFKDELIYQSDPLAFPLTDSERLLVPMGIYNIDVDHRTHDHPEYGLVHTIEYTSEDESLNDLSVITDSGEVLYSTKDLPSRLPENGIELMSSKFGQYNIISHVYTVENQAYTIIFFNYRSEEQSFISEFLKTVLYVFIALMIVLLISTLLYLRRLNRKVNKPLVLLKQAFEEYDHDHDEKIIHYKGPKEFMEICQRFNEMVTRLNVTQSEKQQIIAGLSHDLRTPLTIIQTYSQAIQDGIVPKDSLDVYLSTIQVKAHELSELVDVLNDYSRLFHKAFELTLEKQDLSLYIQKYLSSISIEHVLAIDGDSLTDIDVFQFKRVLDNLIGNTIKYNDSDVTLYVSIKEDLDYVYLSIGDDGIGIDPSIIETLFQAFVTNDSARKTGKGTGLGLSIVKKIMEMHCGTIELVQSALSVEFLITLPNLKKD